MVRVPFAQRPLPPPPPPPTPYPTTPPSPAAPRPTSPFPLLLRHDDNFGASGGASTLVVHLATKAVLGSYTLKTANDVPSRDPSAWSLYIVHGDGAPDTLSSVDEVSLAPTERLAAYPKSSRCSRRRRRTRRTRRRRRARRRRRRWRRAATCTASRSGVRRRHRRHPARRDRAVRSGRGEAYRGGGDQPGGRAQVANQGPEKLVDGDATSGSGLTIHSRRWARRTSTSASRARRSSPRTS